MKTHLHRSTHFLRTTAIGGLLFLLPIMVVVGLLGYVFHAVVVVHEQLAPWIPFNTPTGIALLFGITVAILLLLCFVTGLVARRAMATHFSTTIEKQLIKVIPKYGIYKDLLAGNIGGAANLPSLVPVLVKREGVLVPALEADRLSNGLVVVYLPGAPDPWNGAIGLFPADAVQPLAVPFNELVGLCERLGRDAAPHLNSAVRDS